jgi:hypothetical protein
MYSSFFNKDAFAAAEGRILLAARRVNYSVTGFSDNGLLRSREIICSRGFNRK